MSYSFVARFDTVELPLAELLSRLKVALHEQEIDFAGSVTQLIEHRKWPTPIDLRDGEDLEGTPVDSIDEIVPLVRRWWGVSLYCVSRRIARVFGRSDAMEVDVAVYPRAGGRWSLLYTESSSVQEHRLTDEDSAAELYDLQIGFASRIGFAASIYEEDQHRGEPVVDLTQVEERISAASRGDLGCSVIVSHKLLDLQRARALAGGKGALVRVATPGFVLGAFLHPDG